MYIRVPNDHALGESAERFFGRLAGPGEQPVGATGLQAMACPLLCASNLVYASPTRATFPFYAATADLHYYTKAGFLDRPQIIDGKQPIDRCLIGTVRGSAVDPAQKSVVLAFRGTVGATDWMNNFQAALVPFKDVPGPMGMGIPGPKVFVHAGFRDSIVSLFSREVPDLIKTRLRENPGAPLYITGHSKGGALAHLAGLLLQNTPGVKVAGVISFEAPRAGDGTFAAAYAASGIDSLRYEFQDDIAPHVPPTGAVSAVLQAAIAKSAVVAAALSMAGVKHPGPFAYEHVGKLRFVDWNGNLVGDSPKLQNDRVLHLSAMLTTGVANPLGARPLFDRLKWLHAIECGPTPSKTSGLWRAVCGTDSCG